MEKLVLQVGVPAIPNFPKQSPVQHQAYCSKAILSHLTLALGDGPPSDEDPCIIGTSSARSLRGYLGGNYLLDWEYHDS